MANHTPGPWRNPTGSCGIFASSNDRVAVAEALRCPVLRAKGGTRIREHSANASLIAAAPDMLAVCHAYLDGISGICGANAREATFLEKIEDMARAAVEKAEG